MDLYNSIEDKNLSEKKKVLKQMKSIDDENRLSWFMVEIVILK